LAGFPNLANEMKKAHKEALELGFVRNEAGRIRHLQRAKELYAKYGQVILDDLELWKKFHEMPGLYAQAKTHRRELKNLLNNAFNFKVQGLVANIINRATIATARAYELAGLTARIIANIHDELIVHAPEAEAAQAAQILQQCMENAWPLSVPMIAVPSFGQNFRDAKG
jgi:DNA polymerase I-like protein with 3'-5' exonuclease and polymerase domains